MTIETTHVGSLPRGDELSSFLIAKDKGEAYDSDQFENIVQNAINGEFIAIKLIDGIVDFSFTSQHLFDLDPAAELSVQAI